MSVSDESEGTGPTKTEWENRCTRKKQMSRATLNRLAEELLANGFVAKVDGSGTSRRGASHAITEKGREQLSLKGVAFVSSASDRAGSLVVLSREVGCAGDGWSVDDGVVAVMVLGVEPVGKSVGAFGV